MMYFNKEEIDFLKTITGHYLGKTDDPVKQSKRLEILTKVESLSEGFDEELALAPERLVDIDDTLEALHILNTEYASCESIGDIDSYDRIKKSISIYLEFLGTLKDEIWTLSEYLENKVKKEYRASLVKELMDAGNNKSTADSLVEIDPRYKNRKRQYYTVYQLAQSLRTKYRFYSDLWSKVFQSVSTASKEQYASKQN